MEGYVDPEPGAFVGGSRAVDGRSRSWINRSTVK